MFYNILDKKRLAVLPFLKNLKKDFYLAGGTALALQIGHRSSVNFDFFTSKDIKTNELFNQIKEIFSDRKIKKIQDEKNILTVIIDKDIKISFFSYKYPLLNKLIDEPYLKLASMDDIACMKLSAITSRSTLKDYVDLYFILQTKRNNGFPIKSGMAEGTILSKLLNLLPKKFPELDTNLILKSLVYFDDLTDEKIIFRNNNNVSLSELKKFFQKIVKELK